MANAAPLFESLETLLSLEFLLILLGACDGRKEEEEEAEKQKEEEEECVQQQQRQWRSPLAQLMEDALVERGVNIKQSMDTESDANDNLTM